MAQKIRNVMQKDPVCLSAGSPVSAAATAMRDAGIGDVIVEDDGQVCGIVTDRDIVVRVVAEQRAPDSVKLGEICSRELITVAPDDPVDDAVETMRSRALRRLPVLEGGRPVGIVSLGDLAMERDPHSALGAISAAPANV
jgi:CBS domain-containing protein